MEYYAATKGRNYYTHNSMVNIRGTVGSEKS
jgi:hypothetical protein